MLLNAFVILAQSCRFFFTRIRTSEKVSKIGLEQNLFFRLKSAGVGCG